MSQMIESANTDEPDKRKQFVDKAKEYGNRFWNVFLRKPFACFYEGVVIPFLFFLSLGVNSRFFAAASDTLARSVVSISFLHIRILAAHILAVFLMFVSYVVMILALTRIRHGVSEKLRNQPFEYYFPIGSAVLCLCVDVTCFYCGLLEVSPFRLKRIQLIPAMIALGYGVAIVWLGYFHCVLWEKEDEK